MLIYKLIKSLPPEQREALILCARGFGKSFLEVVLALEDCLQNPGVEVAIIGPSLKQTKDIVSPLMKVITKDAPKGLITQKRSSITWEFANGSILCIGGFDTALEASRGRTFYNVYLEETGFSTADLDEYSYILYSVLMSTLRSRIGARLTHFTTPARVVDHALHTETLPKCKLNSALYIYTIFDNPMLTAQQIATEIESMGGIDSVNVRRELLCLIERDDAITVVPQFDEDRHVAQLNRSPNYKYMVCGDLGYKADKTAFHLIAYDHDIGKVVVLEEIWMEANRATPEVTAALKEKWGDLNPTYVVDYQGNEQANYATEGISLVFPQKDHFDSTVSYIRNLFFKDTVLIDPEKCPLLVQTLRSQIFNKQKSDFLRTATLGHADALMSITYGCRSVDKQTDLRPKPDPSKTWSNPALLNPHLSNLRKLGHQ